MVFVMPFHPSSNSINVFLCVSNVQTGSQNAVTSDLDPDFTNAITNVTVPIGREAILSCSVSNLGHFKVGWLKAEDQTILTLHNKVVTHNSRISVTHDNANTWQLRIRQVKESDRGCYMCQINTNKMKKQLGCVDVHVPPDIIDEETSSDVTVREGENATLICRAKGHPVPRIIWKREDGDHLLFKSGPREIIKVDSHLSDTYSLTKVSRTQMGAYLCIASNDVPPAVSKRVVLNINFAPSIKIPNQLLGAPLGTNVLLECHVEAFPNTINYWMKNRGEMLLNGKKHIIEEEKNLYKVHLKLTVSDFNKNDLGTYMCVSTNSLGRADGTIRLYEIKVPTKIPTTTTTTTSTTEISYTYTAVGAIEGTTIEKIVEIKRKFIQSPTTLASLGSLKEEGTIGRSSSTLEKDYNEKIIFLSISVDRVREYTSGTIFF
ncbi:lachesin precursor, putative [Pediculus humanus corporis]|uniref:Lachesin, putative n=1 Tax=Pediculus humanus subsp. corporis TaxID=121224 RepID=E0VYZ0_PEDHC|nr:lachesin precursor, putative [Pediculus humanus corporis]EEB18596.1 lachesin precursor, putative [Pediculus humanus corporis]